MLVLVLETPHGEISDVTVMEVLHGGRSSTGSCLTHDLKKTQKKLNKML